MPRNLTAADRSTLIRLASTLPVGSEERKAILAGLAAEGLLSDKQASRPPLDKEQIAEIEKEGWPDMMSQAEASDWAVNTIRQAWRERGMVGKPEQMMREEFDRIRKGNLDYLKYLRVSRAGSKFRIDRAMRRAIYIQYLAKNKKVKSELWRRLR
ncbi:MAG: hypothetical protein CMJ67_10305 [Planctomycetaceae bacterium]|nr:hypothetical protein [Planctomycetaceae bacterium]